MKYTQATNRRRGVTLTEVLSSILIMGLGVTFVISLFPVAMLRSLKASQLTNAALTRLNAEAVIDIQPGIIHDPDGDGNSDEHFTFPGERHYIIDPWGYTTHWIDDLTIGGASPRVGAYRDWFGNDGAVPALNNGQATTASPGGYPAGIPSIPRFDGGLFNRLTAQNGAAPSATLMEQTAAKLVGSRDGWTEFVEVELTADDLITTPGGAAVGVNLPDDVSLVDLMNNGIVTDNSIDWNIGIDTRIVVFNETGRLSVSYPVVAFSLAPDSNRVMWTEDFIGLNATLDDPAEDHNENGELEVRALPAGFTEISRVVIEVARERHYSWLLTVRKNTDGQAGVDVVVMFNRSVDPENELVFPATFVAQQNIVLVKNRADGMEPFLKKGGYIFDAVNARWYQVQGYNEPPTIGPWAYGTYDYEVIVNRTVLERAGEDQNFLAGTFDALDPSMDLDGDGVDEIPAEDLDGDGVLDFGAAIFLPGVIEVYPLGTKQLPETRP